MSKFTLKLEPETSVPDYKLRHLLGLLDTAEAVVEAPTTSIRHTELAKLDEQVLAARKLWPKSHDATENRPAYGACCLQV